MNCVRVRVTAFTLAISFTVAAAAADYEWQVIRVIYSDTAGIDATPDLPPELARLSVRLRGVDTWELRTAPGAKRNGAAAWL